MMFPYFDVCLPRVLTLNDLPWKLPSQHLCPENVQIFSMLILRSFSGFFHRKHRYPDAPQCFNQSMNTIFHIKISFGSSPSAAYHHGWQRWENWLHAFSSLTNPLFSDCCLRQSPRERRIFSDLQYVSWDALRISSTNAQAQKITAWVMATESKMSHKVSNFHCSSVNFTQLNRKSTENSRNGSTAPWRSVLPHSHAELLNAMQWQFVTLHQEPEGFLHEICREL